MARSWLATLSCLDGRPHLPSHIRQYVGDLRGHWDGDTIAYHFTIEDESRWIQPFSGEFPFVRTDEDLFEYACHEGNYSMSLMLSGARTLEGRGRASAR